jgi:hypothetical protein
MNLLPTAGPSAEASAGRENPGSGFSQRCLAKSQGSTPEERQLWRDGIYDQIREVIRLQGNLSTERMCELARVSRASFYRTFQKRQLVEEEPEVRSGSSRSPSTTVDVMGIAVFPPNYDGGVCR